jgi:hypothetical protein
VIVADEVLGNIYEAITQIALEEYTAVVKAGEQIFFEQKPKGITIKPDLTVGRDKDHPRVILQIHHTNAESASHHKFWRNIGEFVDARLALGANAIIGNIVFDSGQKRQLAVVSEALFDGFLEADRASYGRDLLKLGEVLTAAAKKKKVPKNQRPDLVREEVTTTTKARRTVKAFAADLERNLASTSKLSSGWFAAYHTVQAVRPKPRIPARRVTTVRRGLGRLLPVSDESVLRHLLKAIRQQTPVDTPVYMEVMALVSSVAGTVKHRIDDQAIAGLTATLTDDQIVHLWRESRNSSQALRQACAAIEQTNEFPKLHAVISAEIAKLSTASGMKKALEDCFKNPDDVLGHTVGLSNPGDQGNWVFEYVMVAIKASTGKQQGYGYTRLGDESGFRFEIAATAGVVLSPYLQRRKPLPPKILDGISTALARRIDELKTWIPANFKEIAAFLLRSLFEDKIYKIAAFDPLAILLSARLPRGAWARTKRCPTLLTEVLGKKGIATIDVLLKSGSAIVWQSASDKGVVHKTKELMGRLGMLRVSRDARGKMGPNARIDRIALVVDGTWTVAHLQRLAEAGADGIFYPDELDKLVTFLK